MCVALAALDALVHLEGPNGKRTLKFVDLHRLPGGRPDIETELESHELITAIELPALPFATRSTYRKVRDRASYAFALFPSPPRWIWAPDGTVRDVRLAMGGVAHKPWRAWKAEGALRGQRANRREFPRGRGKQNWPRPAGLRDNTFKIELARRVIEAVLSELAGEFA